MTMPGLDGTGPAGMGPMTGGARGWCNPAGPMYRGYGAWGNPAAFGAMGYGPMLPRYPMGYGMPWGGYGMMPGMGMAWGRGRAPFGMGRGMAWGRGGGRGRGWW